ncbi:MAG: glycosyltransferase family 2 protein [Rhodobacteraceae bacterium]|nr:glycosyltransferase family 2 protein [Paracoccaceae bacterium]
MPAASIIVPAYNAEHYLPETLNSLLAQTYTDYEIIVVDDGSTDQTVKKMQAFSDPRLKVIRQSNRGLAGARNSGIAEATGKYIGFCDSDDLWMPRKLEKHIRHLEARPGVGLSFSGSALIDENSLQIGLSQTPKTMGISAKDVLLRNPIGNGSSPVFRRTALQDIAWRPDHEQNRDWWFDEDFRQTEDIECWMRFVLTTSWKIEGLPEDLTLYRVNASGLSADIEKQRQSWEQMIVKIQQVAPAFVSQHAHKARAYHLRYLARRAISMSDSRHALRLLASAAHMSLHPLFFEPVKTLTTIFAALVQQVFGPRAYGRIFRFLTGNSQNSQGDFK